MMSVNEYSAAECGAATTHAAQCILSVHGVFEVAALISTVVRVDFQGVVTGVPSAFGHLSRRLTGNLLILHVRGHHV
jgi:hypothetical protein